jgi:hypothetical protein
MGCYVTYDAIGNPYARPVMILVATIPVLLRHRNMWEPRRQYRTISRKSAVTVCQETDGTIPEL